MSETTLDNKCDIIVLKSSLQTSDVDVPLNRVKVPKVKDPLPSKEGAFS